MPIYHSRIAQLTNKSNQFNLTTRRLTESEIAAAAENEEYICRCGKLTDKFGDNGIVTVVIGRKNAVSSLSDTLAYELQSTETRYGICYDG